jgi:hypothetical protein
MTLSSTGSCESVTFALKHHKLTLNDILPQLRSRKASAFGFLPLLGGYARGVTAMRCWKRIDERLQRLMIDLGYLGADVKPIPHDPADPGFFDHHLSRVTEGPLTRVADISDSGRERHSRKSPARGSHNDQGRAVFAVASAR